MMLNTVSFGYDPEEHGALCHQCGLNTPQTYDPVPPEFRSGALLTVCAEAPGKTEVAVGTPLIGPPGREMMRVFEEQGWTRENLSITNACLCRFPKDDADLFHLILKKRNAKRLREGREILISPFEACWPRLHRELHLAGSPNVLLLGKHARNSIFEHRYRTQDEIIEDRRRSKKKDTGGILGYRGFPDFVQLPPLQRLNLGCRLLNIISSVHPTFVLRSRKWTIPFELDLAKSVRMAEGRLEVFEPEIHLFPSPEQVENYLDRIDDAPEIVAHDVESMVRGEWAGEHLLRCVGIGTHREVMVIPLVSVEHPPRKLFAHDGEKERVEQAIVRFFKKPGLIADQNGIYDWTVYDANLPGFEMLRDRFDTVVGHHVAFSEFKHNLGFLSSQYTDNHAHKDVDHDAWNDDREYHIYNARDVGVTSWSAEKLIEEPSLIGQQAVLQNDMFLSTFCKELTQIGMKMDLLERDRLYASLSVDADRFQAQARAHAVEALRACNAWSPARERTALSLNLSSSQQMGGFIYETLGIQPIPANEGGFTDTGEPAVSKPVLFSLMDKQLPSACEEFLLSVIDYREADKLIGTYCRVEPASDGRVHSTWSPHVTPTGRLSSSGPNLQNLKKIVRTIYCSEAGHGFVAWDYAQLEARITAVLARLEDQILAFQTGGDIHKLNACAIFGKDNVDDIDDKMRQFAKTFVYAVQYLAGFETVYRMIRNFRAKGGARPYKNIGAAAIHTMMDTFWARRSALSDWHAGNRELQRKQGFLAEPITGRRRYFLDSIELLDDKEMKANHLVQSCLPKETRILTKDGIIPIGTAPAHGTVWTGTAWATYQKIHSAPCQLGEIHLKNGQILKCDTNHQVLIEGEDEYRFAHWKELKQGDQVCLSLPRPLHFGSADTMSEDDAYWLGFLIGNGSLSRPEGRSIGHRNAMTNTIGNRKTRYDHKSKFEEYRGWIESKGHQLQKPCWYDNYVSATVESASFVAFLEDLGYPIGCNAHTKTVPLAVWRSSLNLREQFLLGLLDADGCVSMAKDLRKGTPTLHTCNRNLLHEVMILSRSIGVESTIEGPYQGGISWRLRFNTGQLSRLDYGRQPLANPRTNNVAPLFVVQEMVRLLEGRMAKHHTSTATLLHRIRHGGTMSVHTIESFANYFGIESPICYASSPVVAKIELPEVEPTYTLSVDDPGHRFDSEGVISKNTAAAIVNAQTKLLREEFPLGFDGPKTGIVQQGHDSIIIECKEENMAKIAKRGKEILSYQLLDMPIPVDCQLGYSFGRLREVKI